jgi:hypothetical protein
MPEINHKGQPISTVSAATATIDAPTKEVAAAIASSGAAGDSLESKIEAVLAKLRAKRIEEQKPKEPDYTTLNEADAMTQDVYIPMIEHELPDYMNVILKDTEYEVVWASKDQRRLGQLIATGYEFLKKEHVLDKFKLPLLFNSEGLYEYMDVIALRVHKRILYGKRKKALMVSINQLSNRNRPPRARVGGTFDLQEPVSLGPNQSFYSDIA